MALYEEGTRLRAYISLNKRVLRYRFSAWPYVHSDGTPMMATSPIRNICTGTMSGCHGQSGSACTK